MRRPTPIGQIIRDEAARANPLTRHDYPLIVRLIHAISGLGPRSISMPGLHQDAIRLGLADPARLISCLSARLRIERLPSGESFCDRDELRLALTGLIGEVWTRPQMRCALDRRLIDALCRQLDHFSGQYMWSASEAELTAVAQRVLARQARWGRYYNIDPSDLGETLASFDNSKGVIDVGHYDVTRICYCLREYARYQLAPVAPPDAPRVAGDPHADGRATRNAIARCGPSGGLREGKKGRGKRR